MAALIEMLTTPFVALFAFIRRLWTRWTWERFLDGLRKMDDERVYPEAAAQRESFVYGNCNIDNPDVTREMVSRAVPELYAIPSDETTQRSSRDVAPVTEGEALDYVERRKL